VVTLHGAIHRIENYGSIFATHERTLRRRMFVGIYKKIAMFKNWL